VKLHDSARRESTCWAGLVGSGLDGDGGGGGKDVVEVVVVVE